MYVFAVLFLKLLQPYIKEMQSTVKLIEQRSIIFILNYAEQCCWNYAECWLGIIVISGGQTNCAK